MLQTREKILIEPELISDQQSERRVNVINDVLKASGLVVDERHNIRITPDRLVLNSVARRQFEEIGSLILSSFKATEQVFLKAQAKELPPDLSKFIVNSLEAGMQKGDKKTLGERKGQLPLFFRSDCVLSQTEEGLSVKLTEIEGERSIGFGFASLVDRINRAINKATSEVMESGMGVGLGIKEAIRQSRFRDRKIGLILGEDQLFYLPEQLLFVDELCSLGLPVELVRESMVMTNRAVGNLQLVLPSGIKADTAVSLPVFNRVKSNKTLEPEELRLAFIADEFQFLLPPKKFFGTKSSLALMHQPLVRELFEQQGVDLSKVDKFIPPTRVIAGQISEVERIILEMGLQTDPPTLIKAVGMTAGRGMALPDDREGIEHILGVVVKKPENKFEFVTQQFQNTIEVPFRILDGRNKLVVEKQFIRLGAFFANINGRACLLGVVGTGLGNPFVHGNPKCIQFPVVFRD